MTAFMHSMYSSVDIDPIGILQQKMRKLFNHIVQILLRAVSKQTIRESLNGQRKIYPNNKLCIWAFEHKNCERPITSILGKLNDRGICNCISFTDSKPYTLTIDTFYYGCNVSIRTTWKYLKIGLVAVQPIF